MAFVEPDAGDDKGEISSVGFICENVQFCQEATKRRRISGVAF
jgi:hypothetical protein